MPWSNGVQPLQTAVLQLGEVWADTDCVSELWVGVSVSWVICLLPEPHKDPCEHSSVLTTLSLTFFTFRAGVFPLWRLV